MSDSEEEQYVYSDDESDGFIDGDGDAAMGSPSASKKDLQEEEADSQPVRMRESEFVLLDTPQVEKMMQSKVRDTSELLDVPPDLAEVLLRQKGWSSERLTEAYWADGERLRADAGVAAWAAGPGGGVALPAAPRTQTCRICFDAVPADQARASPCGHFFCEDCYGAYLENQVREGSACVLAKCPEQKCTTVVPPALWDSLLEAKAAVQYGKFRLEHFVGSSKDLRWCPGAGCGKVVRAGGGVTSVRCAVASGGCGAAFCVRCGEEAHAPAGCKPLSQWSEKCSNESETANWILANTKRCPKCNTRIEKNQGCNHIVCSVCKYDFCWMCMGPWADHGATTGGYYKCNKFDPNAKNDDDQSDSARAKRELDRYLHYYKRYHNHDQAQTFATKQLEATERRMVELQETTAGSSWIDVQFLKAANEMVIDCRRVLKYTYVYGYYLDPNHKKVRDLFENLQEHLEKFTESLSGMTELSVDQMDRTEIVNVTRCTESFLANLIQGVDSGLDIEDEPVATA